MTTRETTYRSVQEAYLPFDDPSDSMIRLDNGTYCAVIEVGGTPLSMLNEDGKNGVIGARARVLSGLNHPILESVRSHRVRMDHHAQDVQRWLERLDPPGENTRLRMIAEEIQAYCQEFGRSRARAEKHSYTVIPADTSQVDEERTGVLRFLPTKASPEQEARRRAVAKEQLEVHSDAYIRGIETGGGWARRLETRDIIDLSYVCWAAERAFEHPLHHSALVGDGIERDNAELLVRGTNPVPVEPAGDDFAWDRVDLDALMQPVETVEPKWYQLRDRATRRRERRSRERVAEGEQKRIVAALTAARRCVADDIAPSGTTLTDHYFKVDSVYTRTLVIDHLPRRVSRGWMDTLLDLDETVDLALYIEPLETAEMLKRLTNRIAAIDSSRRLNAEKGRNPDPELEVAIQDMERMQTLLQKGEEKVFSIGIYITVRAGTLKALNALTQRVENIISAMMAHSKRMTHEHDLGFMTTLPQYDDRINRRLTVDLSTVALAPTARLTSPGQPRGILHGVMIGTGTPVLLDPFDPALDNANKTVIATSGGGKSYRTKIEAALTYLAGNRVRVVDPENEYGDLCQYLGGTEIVIGPDSGSQINIFDLPAGVDPRLDASRGIVRERVLAALGMVEIMVAPKNAGLTPSQITAHDKAAYKAYQDCFDAHDADPEERPNPLPTLRDYIVALEAQGPVGQELAEAMRVYDEGSLSGILSGHTNVDLSSAFLSYNIHQITDERQKAPAVYLFTTYMWTEARRKEGYTTVILDEGWWMFRFPRAAEWVNSLFRRARKYLLSVILIVQEAGDLLQSEYGQACFKNAATKILLKQDASNLPLILENLPGVTEGDADFLRYAAKGQCIVFRDGGKARVQVEAPGPILHRLASTRRLEEAEAPELVAV
jgi:hypothetical protein